ncbi:MAG: carboxypeptidase regulatory-like domain-containing protein, partial [Acidimicrobiales bacterium]
MVHNSLGGLQLGRYRFEIRATGNGNALIEGVVTDAASGAPLAGAHVQLCRDFVCYITTTNSSGHYAFLGLVAGDYSVTAFPAGLSHFQSTVPVPALGGAEARVVNIMLTGPTPPPFGASITPAQVNSQGVPRVFWNNPITLTISACPGGTATWEVHKNGVLVPGRSGTMTEAPAGTFKASIPALNPTSGAVEMVIAVTCPDGSTSSGEFDFNIYIDPSGVVMDTFGTLQVGATVTLFRSDQPGGPFTQVPDGSAIMSPSNRTNPDLTDSVGHFGWDVIAGYYTVRAEKAGCTDPANSAQAFVETEVLTIPPPVFDLELVLECPQADFTSLIPARILDTR